MGIAKILNEDTYHLLMDKFSPEKDDVAIFDAITDYSSYIPKDDFQKFSDIYEQIQEEAPFEDSLSVGFMIRRAGSVYLSENR